MTENTIDPKADAAGDKLDAILKAIGGLVARVDEMEKNLPASELMTAADKKKRKDDDMAHKRKDDDDEEEMAHMKVKKDSKHRKDAEGSNKGIASGPAGEIKPDDDDDDMHHGHKDDDDDRCDDDDDAKKHHKRKDDDEEAMMDDDDEEAARKDEEMEKMADCQAAADSIYSAFGKSASRPLKGESLSRYRTRLLRGLQAYSDAYKDVNLSAIKDAKLLSIAEKQIFSDAMVAAKSPTMYADGQLHEILETDRRTGRTISKFVGPMSAWLNQFKVPALRAVSFNTNNVKR